ncbi:MAG TPA: FtsX-like permease family protein [Bacteroidota bacterium]|nr:FtsX-like permease family protein [Bacteroidota bacterium]
MSVERSIALRYLISKRKLGLVTLISIISVVGVTIGVAALVIVLSVFNGFSGLVTSILVNFDPHIRVESPHQAEAVAYDSLIRASRSRGDVQGVSSFVIGKAVVVSRNLNRVINVKGIDPSTIAAVSGLKDKLVLGSLDLVGPKSSGIVLGMTLADRLGAVVGDTVSVVSLAGSEVALLQLGQPLIRRFHVVGIYESNNKDYDSFYAYVNIVAAQLLFGMGTKVNGVELRLRSIDQSDAFKKQLEAQFGNQFRILTWYDLHRDLYSVMKIERWMAYIILCLIIGVASFNLLGSLTMSVVEKTRDIGILKAMGATRSMIVKIFMFEGVLVGILGSMLGLILGLVVVWMQDRLHLFPLDPTVYIIPAIPVEVHLLDLVIVAVTALGLCSLAALYPARRAASFVPVEAIRWE